MRKIFLFAILFFLAGCGQNAAEYEIETVLPFVQDEQEYWQSILDEPQQTQPDELEHGSEFCTEEIRQPTPPLNIREPWEVDGDFLLQFENIHGTTYLQWYSPYPQTLILWPNEPLRDFSFVSVYSNAICCAYVGRSMLTVDELQPSDAVVLTLALMGYIHPACGIIFTDANDERHYKIFFQEIADMEDGRSFHLSDFGNLISRREDWVCLEIITLPASFSYDKGGRWNDVVANTNCPLVPLHEIQGEPSQIWAGYLKSDMESMVERSLSTMEFIFDDGHIGYMLDFENDIWWVRDWMAMSFRHGGYRAFFEIHEDLILQIARTLRVRGS